jgi:ABC-type nitrate/sulfonate/bicarbonate transport system permease component
MSERLRSWSRAAVTLLLARPCMRRWRDPAGSRRPDADAAQGGERARDLARRRHDDRHAASTLYRVLFGLVARHRGRNPLGILMGRFRAVENFVLPLASALMPIPSLAWVPVFILWFGLGNTVRSNRVLRGLFPMLLNAWAGVRAVNPLWLRAAGAMGADENALFWKVIIPGASPFIITGLRQAFLRAWIAVVGAEMLAASDSASAGSFSTPRSSSMPT